MTDIHATMETLGQQARQAAARLAFASADSKSQALIVAARQMRERVDQILTENAKDMAFGRSKGLSAAMLDRLFLDAERVNSIADALDTIAAQDDPVGCILDEWSRPNGLQIQKVSTPLGVIGVIYESRPNVTADAGALCLKAGNAVILRGGSESFHSATILHSCLVEGLRAADLPEHAIQLVPTRDRAAVTELLTMVDYVDVIVPRGGKGLVGLVQREARVPVFAHLEGIVHIYIDRDADVQKTFDVVLNSKTRRTGICGSAECLLIHRDVAQTLGQDVINMLIDAGVEVRADEQLQSVAGTSPANDSDWGCEYLDSIIAARIVDDVDMAIDHIATYGSHHTDCIMTENIAVRDRFFERVDSAILMHNASTQFADGGEFGLGAEIGIATGKLHARGPVGAQQLTSFKYQVLGNGTTRS